MGEPYESREEVRCPKCGNLHWAKQEKTAGVWDFFCKDCWHCFRIRVYCVYVSPGLIGGGDG